MTEAPYQLVMWGDLVCARGPDKAVRDLLRLQGARAHSGFVSFPASRENLMVAEAVADPEHCSDEYVTTRARLMAPTPEQRAYFLAHCPPLLARPGGGPPLLPHQFEWAARTFGSRGGVNASDRGTGKTAPSWVLTAAWRHDRVLIVCKKDLMGEYEAEAAKVLPPDWRHPVIALGDSMSVPERSQVLDALQGERVAVVVNYDVIDAMLPAILRFAPEQAVFDESWRLKCPTAKVSKAAVRIADQARHVIAMTGSLFGNDVGDAWAQVRLLMTYSMQWFPDYDHWMLSYATYRTIQVGGGRRQVPVGCRDPVGLIREMAPVYYRAPKEACLRLPPPRHHFVDTPLWSEAAQWYRLVERDGEAALGDGTSLTGDRVKKVRLQQICGGHLVAPVGQTLAGMEARAATLPCEKMLWLRRFAEEQLEGTPAVRALVWCKYNLEVQAVSSMLAEILGPDRVATFTGATPATSIEPLKASFNSRDPSGVQVMVCQNAKMFAGHNLQSADHSVLYSYPWSYIQYEQLLDRNRRLGREGAVDYWHLVTPTEEWMEGDSIDVLNKECLDRKADLSALLQPDTVADRLDDL